MALLISRAFHPEREDSKAWLNEGPGDEYAQAVCDDLEQLYEYLGILESSSTNGKFFTEPRPILVTPRLACIFCPQSEASTVFGGDQTVRLLDGNFRSVEADLFIAFCQTCDAEYHPDRISYRRPNQSRMQKPEYRAKLLRVSKHGIWMDRRIALAQENAILRFRSGWSNFADWLSDTIGEKPRVTTRQSQRLYFELFSRRLITAHELIDTFSIPSNSDSKILAETVREQIGINGLSNLVPKAFVLPIQDYAPKNAKIRTVTEPVRPLSGTIGGGTAAAAASHRASSKLRITAPVFGRVTAASDTPNLDTSTFLQTLSSCAPLVSPSPPCTHFTAQP
ncbi:hypothetical protein B0H13DRAFT_2342255 [Mycena leptocephala]|nr:hypothetical protein B0H13DRAFT_2342255 [Mycena leptocephala]